MSILRFGIVASLFLLAGCGSSVGSGTASGGLKAVVTEDTAPYAVLELATGDITWYLTPPAGNPALLKTTHMAFRRVSVGGGGDALVGIFEVTQDQWQRLYGSPAPPTWPWQDVPDGICDSATAQGPYRPAYNLEYETTAAVIDSYGPGHARLALPTDAQWTAACGVSTGWWWGTTPDQTRLATNTVVRESILAPARIPVGSFGVDTAGPLDVGSRGASPLGFYDIHGNVWELIAGGDHVRGGSWRDSAEESRAEVSLGNAQGYHGQLDYALVGMRLVLIP